jgi:hypothetical protein
MRRVLMMALFGAAAAAVPVLPAQAATTLVGTFSGNQCTGGDITTCYASGTTAGTGLLTQVGPNGSPVPGSPGILALDNTGTMTGFTDSLSTDPTSGHEILNYTYTGTELATYFGIFQGGSSVGCSGQGCYNNTYLLFYNPTGFTSGTFDLSTLFNNPGVSHVALFDNGGAPVPEPATWALMLLGFGGIGFAMRRGRRNLALQQLA